MRPILFRGKSLDDGSWCLGYLGQVADKTTGKVIPAIIDTITEGQYTTTLTAVDENTIGQFVGVTDSHGVMLFEGDIIESIGGCRKVVEFGGPVLRPMHGKATSCDAISTYINNYEKRVIGNIHDNPELLKGGNNERPGSSNL
jgi:hypothetical protein